MEINSNDCFPGRNQYCTFGVAFLLGNDTALLQIPHTPCPGPKRKIGPSPHRLRILNSQNLPINRGLTVWHQPKQSTILPEIPQTTIHLHQIWSLQNGFKLRILMIPVIPNHQKQHITHFLRGVTCTWPRVMAHIKGVCRFCARASTFVFHNMKGVKHGPPPPRK